MKSFFISLLLLLNATIIFGQDGSEKKDFRNAVCIDAFGHNYGLGLGLDYWRLNGARAFTIHAQISSFKDRHETHIKSIYNDQGGKDFIFDKKNYFYSLSALFGISRTVLGSSQNNRVSFRLGGSLGFVLGMLKPYYEQVAVPTGGGMGQIEERPYDRSTLSYGDIYGQGDYFMGISDMKFIPGLSARISGLLNLSQNQEYIRGIEFFIFADIYTKKIEILDAGKDRLIFPGAGLAIQIGNAW